MQSKQWRPFLYMCKNSYFNFGGIFLTDFFGHNLRSQSWREEQRQQKTVLFVPPWFSFMETDIRRAQAALQPRISGLAPFRLCQQVAEADQRSTPLLRETRPGDTASARRGDPRVGFAATGERQQPVRAWVPWKRWEGRTLFQSTLCFPKVKPCLPE